MSKCTIIYKPEFKTGIKRPLFESSVAAGFASFAEDKIDQFLDLNEHLIQRPAATYFVKVSGDSMVGAGIFSGDILIVDRSITPTHNAIVVAMVENEFLVKRLHKRKNEVMLMSENTAYSPIKITDSAAIIWGVVTYTIHKPS